jgi:hypothetical protein
VSPAFAWQHRRTDISNWNDPPARFSLEGPFEAGSRGTTLLPGDQTMHWSIREVRPGESFFIEMPLDGATLACQWCFVAVSEHSTRLTQHIVLSGENAKAYVS